MKRATWAALSVGLVLGASCGAAKVLPGPTTILVKVHLIAAQDIDQLYVTGTVNGFDEFPRTYLPEDAGSPFNGPQTFRIFLADSEDGKSVEVDVFGVTQGNPVAAGTATVAVVKQHEVEADIDLSPSNNDSGPGGGSGGGSGTGGGVGTGGGAAGGGTASCGCDGGCCEPSSASCSMPKQVPLSRLPNGSFTVTDCGAPGMTCEGACDPVKGFCNGNGKCTCGPNLSCHDGERCVVSGTAGNLSFACRCDELSGCNGCCANNSTCVPVASEDGGRCGAAGSQCEVCNSGGTASICANGICNVPMCQSDKCASGNDCLEVQFPTCTGVLNNRCVACDPLRSNQCSRLNGAQTQGCACGMNKQCDPGEYCDNSSNCVKLF